MKESSAHGHHDISSNTIFGFWVYLMTDFILFATLFAAYAVLRNDSARELFDVHFALIDTLVLLASCFTFGMAMVALGRQEKKKILAWLGATFVLGLVFLTQVAKEATALIDAGYTWTKSGFLSSYFTLVGTHWLHVAFGLLFIILFGGQIWRCGVIEVTIRRMTCLGMFWFFSYLVWVFMFTFVYLMGAA